MGARKNIGRQGLQTIEAMAADGFSLESIAQTLRMDRKTLLECRKRQPEVQEALERGHGRMESELVNGLMQRFRAGHMDPRDKSAITAAFFLLKSKRGYEGTKAPTSVTINDNRKQQVLLPSPDAMEDYLRRSKGIPLDHVEEVVDA